MLPHRGFQADIRAPRLSLLRGRRKKAILRPTSAVRAQLVVSCLIGASPVTSSSLARCVLGTALAAFLVAAPIELSAQAPTTQDLSGMTAAGSYLAARHAGQLRDAATAAAYYRVALRHDPKNGDLLDRTFLSLVVGGDIVESVKYAERIAQADKNDRVAQLVLGVHALKQKQYAAARRDLAQSIRGPITDLTATLLSAWSMD